MILLGRNGATEKNRFFFIADMENTRSKLSFVRKSSPVAILQNALICGTNNFHFHKLNVPDLVYVPTVSAELT